jgi:5-methylthioadenosine/S-adenosylhomocysteine deaminase
MPFREISWRNIPICLGIDEAIADDAINMWSVMKTAGMLHSLSDPDYLNWPQATEILHAATVGGGQAMRVPGLGTLKEGAPADLILVSLDTLAFLPLNNLPRQLVHCENGGSVRLTMVAGNVVAERGRVTLKNRDALLDEARALFQSRSIALSQASDAMNDRLGDYRAMYLRAMATDVGIERRVSN